MYNYDEIADRIEEANLYGFNFESLYLIELLIRDRLLHVAHRLDIATDSAMSLTDLRCALSKHPTVKLVDNYDHTLDVLDQWLYTRSEVVREIDEDTDPWRQDVVLFGQYMLMLIEQWVKMFG